MKIAVIGGGAIGSIIAGYLAKCDEHEVLLVGRPEHVRAINEKGLTIKSHAGNERVTLRATLHLDQAYDLVIFATKSQDLEQAYQDNHQYLDHCWVMTTQNGVQGDNLLRTHFEPEKMISSIVMFGATYTRPGEVILNFPGDWIMGKPYSLNDEKFFSIVQILERAFPEPFGVVQTFNIMGMKWLKLFVNFNNCIPAVVGKSMQETFADMDFCKLSVLLLKEGVGIVQNAGIELADLPKFPADRIYGMSIMPTEQAAGIINKTLTTLSKEPLYGSILQSIMRNKFSEIDFINGEITLIAKNLKIECPFNDKIVDMVHQVEQRGSFYSPEDVKNEFQLNNQQKGH